MSENNTYYSYHIFLYPFKWEIKNKEKFSNGEGGTDPDFKWEMKNKETFSKKTCLNAIASAFAKNHQGSWERNAFSFRDGENFSRERFNEYQYFYDFVRNALYDFGEEHNPLQYNSDKLVAHFRYKPVTEIQHYYIIRKNKAKDETQNPLKNDAPAGFEGVGFIDYKLAVEYIFLNLYETGVGVITFHLKNYDYPGRRSILNINKFGRRVSVPYLDYEKGIQGTKQAELPDFICITEQPENITGQEKLFEDFGLFYDELELTGKPHYISKTITGLFADDFWDYGNGNAMIKFEPVLDDRMFVVCWAGIENISAEITTRQKLEHTADIRNRTANLLGQELTYQTTDYSHSSFWYKLLFVDDQWPTCTNAQMRHQLLKEHTYPRWSEYGALFGITRYSLMVLTEPLPTLQKNNAAFIPIHLRTIYYKLAELAFVQRTSLLKFSDEISDISGKLGHYNISNRIEDLYNAYIQFINKVYFREVTAQEQGIEMYQLLHKAMQIPKNVEDLDKEFQELHQFVAMQEQKQQTEKATELNRIAAIFLPATLLASILAFFSDKDYSFGAPINTDLAIILVFFVVLVLVSLVYYEPIIKIIINLSSRLKK